jgi:cell division protein FtsQ
MAGRREVAPDRTLMMTRTANALYGLAALLGAWLLVTLVGKLPILPLQAVELRGEVAHITREQAELIARGHMRGNFLTLDLQQLQVSFEKLPWVRRVSVRKMWPGTVVAEMEEHQALARWGQAGLVSTRGELFSAASDETLPVLYGPAGSHAEMARAFAAYRTQLARIDETPLRVDLTPRRAWRVKLASGTWLELGRHDPLARLERLVAVYPSTLAALPAPAQAIDLRYPDGFAVRVGASTAALPAAPTKPVGKV